MLAEVQQRAKTHTIGFHNLVAHEAHLERDPQRCRKCMVNHNAPVQKRIRRRLRMPFQGREER